MNLWEAAGINDADKLLSNLGFFEKDVQISELSNILEEEIQRTVNNDMDLMPLIKVTIKLRDEVFMIYLSHTFLGHINPSQSRIDVPEASVPSSGRRESKIIYR